MMQISTDASGSRRTPVNPYINICQRLANEDFCLIDGQKFIVQSEIDDIAADALDAFLRSWDDLTCDEHMADGGTYRSRRHATLTAEASGGRIRREAHQPHFQKVAYNRLNGGVERCFEPIYPSVMDNPVMEAILRFASSICGHLAPLNRWHVEVHQFRIEAGLQAGNPTPEGVHRDGVQYVLMSLVARSNVVDGETSIHDLEGRRLTTFTLLKPFDSALVNDERVAHGVTPIMRLDPGEAGYRDVLVVTFRRK